MFKTQMPHYLSIRKHFAFVRPHQAFLLYHMWERGKAQSASTDFEQLYIHFFFIFHIQRNNIKTFFLIYKAEKFSQYDCPRNLMVAVSWQPWIHFVFRFCNIYNLHHYIARSSWYRTAYEVLETREKFQKHWGANRWLIPINFQLN